MVSADGSTKQKLKDGECKSLTTDRIVQVLGPRKEVECVRHIFSVAIAGRYGATAIARDLNRRGIFFMESNGRTPIFSTCSRIRNMWGCNVWHRTTQRLRSKTRPVSADKLIPRPGAFAPIVDQQTFDLAHANFPRRAAILRSSEFRLIRVVFRA